MRMLIDDAAKAEIKRVKEYAEAHKLNHAEMQRRIREKDVVGDDPNFFCFIQVWYRVVFTIEQRHQLGWCAHLSVSVDDPKRTPNVLAVQMVMRQFGMSGHLQQCHVWLEKEVVPNAVNVITQL